MRRIRPWAIAATCLLAAVAVVTAALWREGALWRESAAEYLRGRLAAEFGAQFQTGELQGRLFPPGLSLGQVTFQREGQPWVLTAEDVRITLNPYAVLFQRERLGRVVMVRPRLLVRADLPRGGSPAPAPAGAPAPADQAAAPPSAPATGTTADLAPGGVPTEAVQALAGRLRTLLRPPFPLRVLEVEEGRVEVVDGAGRRALATGIDLSVFVARGSARALLEAERLSLDRDGRVVELGGVEADLALEEGRVALREFTAAGGPVSGSLRGTVDYGGALSLQGELAARLEKVAALVGRQGAASGGATFSGSVTGTWRDPQAAGTVAVRDPVFAGHPWPQARGQVSWRGRRLSWSGLRLGAGEGTLTTDGEAALDDGALRYRFEAVARNLAPSWLPVLAGTGAERLRGLAGTLRWEGSGVGGAATGSGRVTATFTPEAWPGEEISVEGEVALGDGGLRFPSFRGATRTLEVAGDGSWSRPAGFAGTIAGTVGDLARLLPAAKIPFGGAGAFEGTVAVDAQGPRFDGSVRIEQASLGQVRGIAARARAVADPGGVRIGDGFVSWPGGRAAVNGTVDVPSGALDLVAVLSELSLEGNGLLLGAGPGLLSGTAGGRLQVRGTAGAPEVSGQVSGGRVRYRTIPLDAAALSFTFAPGALDVTRLGVRRGTTELVFRGRVREGGAIEGEFDSPAFDFADFAPGTDLELAGGLRGRVRGSFADPQVKGEIEAARLRYADIDFKGGELSLDYRGGMAAIEGWVAARENRLRAAVEPGRDWRFKTDLELRQFAPELVRSSLGRLPAGLAQALGRASFLAVGRIEAAGSLKELRSVRAGLELETLWIQAAGASLQNPAPVRVTWRDGVLGIEDFRVAGEQYHLEIRGGGSVAAGWNVQVEGAVDLAGLGEYWREIEDAEGLGDLRLTIGGPWATPVPEGSVTVAGARLRVRSLSEPLEQLRGRIELRGRTLTATGLSGVISGGAFSGGGSYQLAQDRLDVGIEGRLDLALFRGRIPAARDLHGPVDVRMRLAGPIASPSLSGEADVVDAEMFWRAFPAKITQLHGKVVVGNERLEVRGLAGRVGGGSVRLNGTLDWSRSPARVDAELEGEEVVVSLAGDLKAQTDLSLSLRGDVAALKLAGEARILKARYQREFGEKPPQVAPAAGAPPGGAGPDLSRMELDIAVSAADNVWIDNRMAKIETSVALRVGGRLGAPVVSGEISAIQGEATYLSRQFRLESGSLRFAPPATVPLLDVQATTTVGETEIYFVMDGPVNKPVYHLSSNPALDQEDLVALLTIGETRKGLARRGEGASTAGAAVLGTEPLVNTIGDEVRTSMGLEVLQLEPVLDGSKQVSARVTLGTHLSDRLFVSYSQNLGATEDQQFLVQYTLLDYLSVWGQELSQGVYSLDLVFRYTFR